jgi:hypothetical protein
MEAHCGLMVAALPKRVNADWNDAGDGKNAHVEKNAGIAGGIVRPFAQAAANMAACTINTQRSHADYPTLIFRRPWSTSPSG